MSKKRSTSYGTHAGDLNRDLRTPDGPVSHVEHDTAQRCTRCKAEIRLEQVGKRWVKMENGKRHKCQ